jgi:uncharacterized membrane protein
MKKLFVILSVAAFFAISSTAAQAKSFKICNDTDNDARLIKGETTANSSEGIQTAGWFKVEANKCTTFSNVRGSKIHLYAKSDKRLFWRGNKQLCGSSESFEINNADTNACDQENERKFSFKEIELNNGTTTYRLKLENSLSMVYICNKTDAKIFTILGRDVKDGSLTSSGYYGVEGNKCRVLYFNILKEEIFLSAQGGGKKWEGSAKSLCIVEGDAFTLEDSENIACDQEKQAKRGFTKVKRASDGDFNVNFAPIDSMFKLCNTTDEKILTFLGYKDGSANSIASKGWYSVEADKCREFDFDIELSAAYIYAKTNLKNRVWTGDIKLCAKAGDSGYENADTMECLLAGDQRLSFKELEVIDGKTTVTFSSDNAINSRSAVEFCNDMDEDVWMIIGNWDSAGVDQWTTKGWYKIAPMACRQFDDESNSKIMYSAYLSSDKSQVWAGEKMLCSQESNAFHIPKANKVACNKEGQKKIGYSSALLNAGENTIRFSEENLNK